MNIDDDKSGVLEVVVSSIFTNIVIKDKKSVECFIAALEASEQDAAKRSLNRLM